MVVGIDKFREFFSNFEDNYIIIGGTACEFHEESFAQIPRATKDIDIILIVEALSSAFVSRFWDFVKAARYKMKQKGIGGYGNVKHEYYRFMKPEDHSFPYQIELFSRSLGLINFPEDARITPIPVNDDLSSLSAILMDDEYYHFTIDHSVMEEGIHIATIERLICLKSKAFLDLKKRKNAGEQIDSRNIEKHKKDVFRLVAMLAPEDKFNLPDKLKSDIRTFLNVAGKETPNPDFFRAAGLRDINVNDLINQIKHSFIE